MRTSTFLTTTTALLLATVSSALPLHARQADTIQVSIKTGDGDSSIQITVTLDTLFTTPQQAVEASTSDPTAVCQAFSDSAATVPLGDPFNATADVTFVNDGGTGSVASDAVTVGAFLCSSSAATLLVDESKTTSSSSSSSSSSTSSGATVTIELEQSADQFVQGTVPADGSIFLTAGTQFGTLGLDFDIVDASDGTDVNQVTCQAFYDVAAMVVARTFATEANGGDVLTSDRNTPVTVNAFVCSVGA